MNFGNIGMMEILLILVAVLLLFGAKRLPEIGASMGKGIREFKRSITDVDKSLREPEGDARVDRLPPGEHDAPAPRSPATEDRPEPRRLIG